MSESRSRIWIDVRGGEGGRLADLLRMLGFRVEELVPVPCTERESHIEGIDYPGAKSRPLRLELPKLCPFLTSNYQSLESIRPPAQFEEGVRLLRMLLQ